MRLTHGWQTVCVLIALAGAPAFAAPQRVVSTFLCTDEYVFRLVPRAHIAALDYLAGDTHPVVSTISGAVGGITLIRPSTETVLTLKPDLVVLYEGTLPRLRAHLVEAEIPFIEIPWATSLAQVRDITRMLGRKLGADSEAEAMVRQMDRALADAHSRAPHPPVAALIYEPNGYATAGGVTDEIMTDAGLSDAAADLGQTRSGTIPVENIIADAPRLLILNETHRTVSSRADLVLHEPALAALRGHTLMTQAALTPLLCPGPWSVSVAAKFAELGNRARDAAMHLREGSRAGDR